MNYPAPRDIPPGKILVAEYGDPEAKASRAIVEKIAEAAPRSDLNRGWFGETIRLVWSSPGFQIAGSCMTWTNGYWGVFYQNPRDGTRQGRRYSPTDEGEAKARADFLALTTERLST